MDSTPEGFKPPYMSFQTFWNFVEDLGTKPLPPRIDRSLMASKSGTDQTNLTAALRSFDLIGDDGTVLPPLRALAEAGPDDRKVLLATIVRQRYANALAVSETNDTHAALQRTFTDDYNLNASDTRRKAITFFLHALRVAELPYSPHFPQIRAGQGAPGTTRAVRRTPRRKPNGGVPDGRETGDRRDSPADEKAPHSQTVTLRSGGTMTLSVSVNPLTLRGEERDFFYQVVDLLLDYQEALTDPQSSREAEPHEQ